jgi:DNA helicase-2/ATP-dependent DNA helicase PcrA
MAVFYRNNALSRVVEDHLRASGIPYVIARGTAFYQRQEVKDLIAYLRVLANPRDDVSLERIVNKPARKIGQTSLETARQWSTAHGVPLFEAFLRAGSIPGLTGAASGAMGRFAAMVESWSGAGAFMGTEVSASLAALVGRVLAESGLEGYYKIQQDKEPESDNDRVGNLQEVVSSAADFEAEYDPASDPSMSPQDDGTPPLLAMLRAFLERVSLVADADAIDPSVGAVTLMTLHAAKGLEFPAVAMIGLEEGLLPSMRAMESEAQLEEERRLAFVGITRAMRHLLITSARVRTQRGLQERTIASRFLSELPAESIERLDMADEWDDHGGHGGSGHGGFPKSGGRDSWSDFEFDQRSPSDRRASGGASRAPSGPGIGDRVRHPQFGAGEVLQVSGVGMNRRATIKFRDVGVKTLVLEYARLTVE